MVTRSGDVITQSVGANVMLDDQGLLPSGRRTWPAGRSAVGPLLVLALVATGVTGRLGGGDAAPRVQDAAAVVVRAQSPADARGLEAATVALGGQVTRRLPLVDGFAATISPRAAAELSRRPGLVSVTPDARVRVSATPGTTTNADAGEPTSVYRQALNVDRVWQAGDQGQGVTVALVDTGVYPSPDLSARLVNVQTGLLGSTAPCENLSGESTCSDTYGHGTFVAGIIAGNGATGAGSYPGIAPQAKILSVKVAGADGSTDVSNVLAAIQWVVSFKSTYNIGVLNLSLATDSTQTYRTDPFDYAVERAWDAGIVVVTAAGNAGPGSSTITKPGDDPLVITAGAVDDRGTPGIGDDEVPDFTSRGPTAADGLAKPDLVAPGAHLVSLGAPGSTIDRSFPSDILGAYHRGSGTSFSAAATSGVAALMLARNPGITPDRVKYALVASARPLPATSDRLTVGAGEVDAAVAVLTPPVGTANGGVTRSNGTGLLDASRGHVQVQTATVPTTVVNGLLTAQLLVWNPSGYLIGWTPLNWYVSTWYLTSWLPLTWSAQGFPGHNWEGGPWQGSSWDGIAQPRDYGTPIEGSAWFGAWG
jgi:serine protease AprX